jgi:hypothetical protein
MSKFTWTKNEPWTQEMLDSWNLWLADKAGTPRRCMGTMYQLHDNSYVILERGKEKRPMVLDAGLSVDEAKRAAKLFICVGEVA